MLIISFSYEENGYVMEEKTGQGDDNVSTNLLVGVKSGWELPIQNVEGKVCASTPTFLGPKP